MDSSDSNAAPPPPAARVVGAMFSSSLVTGARRWIAGRTEQEKQLLLLAGAIAVVLAGISGISSLVSVLSDQSTRYAIAMEDSTSLSTEMKTLTYLLRQRNEIAALYSKVERAQQDPLSRLENTIRTKLGSEAGIFQITATEPKRFNPEFNQTTLPVSGLRVNSLDTLLSLLKELISGDAPFLLTRLKLAKNEASGRLDVTLDASTISRASAKDKEQGTQSTHRGEDGF